MHMEGKNLGRRYEIIQLIGGGGMSIVYKAKDTLLNRYVALKVLSDTLSHDIDYVKRFSREAQAVARLSHPNVVSIYDVGSDGHAHYIVMELIEGNTLDRHIQERGSLPIREAANIVVQICDGLAHAHEHHIIHRDIKPHNILLNSDGRVKVMDFGIATVPQISKITRTGVVMGSAHYSSPEQAQGEETDARSDIYSLGILFYEMLTGGLPFDGNSFVNIAMKHLQESVPDPRTLNPTIPHDITTILLRSLQKDPSMRYPTAQMMGQEIKHALSSDHRLHQGLPSRKEANSRKTANTDRSHSLSKVTTPPTTPSIDSEQENSLHKRIQSIALPIVVNILVFISVVTLYFYISDQMSPSTTAPPVHSIPLPSAPNLTWVSTKDNVMTLSSTGADQLHIQITHTTGSTRILISDEPTFSHRLDNKWLPKGSTAYTYDYPFTNKKDLYIVLSNPDAANLFINNIPVLPGKKEIVHIHKAD